MKYAVEKNSLSALADAIREKTGKTDSISLSAMPGEIRGIESGGSLLTDNLVVPPGESLIGNNYTINADGTVTVNAYTDWNSIMMYWADIWKDGEYATFSFLPMENGKKYKLTVTPSEDVGEGVIAVNYACFNDDINEEFNVCDIDLKNGNDAIFTVPEEPYYLQYIELPCLSNKSVTYTFDLREVMTKESIYEDGFEAGKKAEYDAFWDGLQDNGSKTEYYYFLYNNASMDWFKPKYDIIPVRASWFARTWGYGNKGELLDLAERLKECGVIMDFSQCTDVAYLFYDARISHLPEIDISSATNGANTLMFGKHVKTIDKFIAPTDKPLTQVFGYCSSLENIVFGSEIGGDITLSSAKKLSKASIESVINALSSTTSGLTLSLSKTAVNNAFGIDVDDVSTYPEGSEYYILRQSKSNWTISYV